MMFFRVVPAYSFYFIFFVVMDDDVAGWVPKANLVGLDDRIFILDFFGSDRLRGRGMQIPPTRFLTAFGAPGNTFLGYFMTNRSDSVTAKLQQGVIWGKDPQHFKDRVPLLKMVASDAKLMSTSTRKVFDHPNVKWLGHLSRSQWNTLLHESKFLLGLGNPILGPSAIDAIASGCMFLNPIFDKPAVGKFSSQHPFAEKLGPPYVCNFRLSNPKALVQCVHSALHTSLQPMLPKDFTFEEHLHRVAAIFER